MLKLKVQSGKLQTTVSFPCSDTQLYTDLAALRVQHYYDLLVKDSEDSGEWICYDNLPDEVKCFGRSLERDMFQVLDRAVEQFGLSYTHCPFQRLDAKEPQGK